MIIETEFTAKMKDTTFRDVEVQVPSFEPVLENQCLVEIPWHYPIQKHGMDNMDNIINVFQDSTNSNQSRSQKCNKNRTNDSSLNHTAVYSSLSR